MPAPAHPTPAANGHARPAPTARNGHASAPLAPPADRPKHATVFIIMDAGRSDYVRPDTMPFLHGLTQQGIVGQFESPPGFAQRTVLFSGRYPDTSGNFSQFVFDPPRSPFKWVKWLGPAKSLIKARKVTWPLRKAIQKVTKWKSGEFHTDPAWIPPKFLPFFAMCEDTKPMYDPGALGAPSLFDLCRQAGKRFRYLAHPVSGDDDEIHQILVRELREGAPYDVYVAQFSVTDERGHQDGPFSDKMQKGHLPNLDQKFASIHAALSANYESWDFFVCGDHGMGPVAREVDVLGALANIDAVPAKDYVVFINSTLAVFWYLTEKGKQAVEKALPGIPGSHIVTDAERRRRRIPVERRWGDRMLAAEPGVMFWPDYFHVQDSTIVGMHGYLDKREESYGIACLASSPGRVPQRNVGLRPLVDVFPTLCELLGLPVPKTNEGTSLLQPPIVTVRPPTAGKSAPLAAVSSPPATPAPAARPPAQ